MEMDLHPTDGLSKKAEEVEQPTLEQVNLGADPGAMQVARELDAKDPLAERRR